MKFTTPIVFVLMFLSACNTPSIGFGTTEEISISEDRYKFKIFSNGVDVQVIRTNRGMPRSKEKFYSALDEAVFRATGCSLRNNSRSGDLNIVKGKLDCK